ncbi:MAG: NADH-quinone oxidoreductase subunit NuoF [Clostridia bacterium]|nr:NADH-quinone oxidoreductase subunit NuoF [Clostridia bacterium]
MKSFAEIENIRKENNSRLTLENDNSTIRVVVGMATCGIAAGAGPVLDALKSETSKRNLSNVVVSQTGCIGACRLEPIVEVYEKGKEKVTYIHMTPEKALKVVEEHLEKGNVVKDYVLPETIKEDGTVQDMAKTAFFKKQFRIALRNCGIIDPENIDEYIAFDGYKALEKVLTSMSREEVVETVKASGLRGRGGAGFSTGMKWMFTANAEGDKKYVCCNADEGDPGAFMDRSVLEGDPHSVIEAMAIAAYAVGADEGYIYIRAEYPIAVQRLKIAINQAKEYGLLGKNIMGTDFSFDLDLRLGAGAFVCGEETALLNSIEGKRGEPRPRPPFPAVKGLWQKPTLLNNVETYANIPVIINKGADWFSAIGTEKSKGTKVFALGGKINNTGLVEIPMGTTLREIVEEIGGGIPNGKKFKAAQTGGPSGGCIPASKIDVPIDYDSLIAIGSMMGSGGLIVMDEDNCMVDIAKFFLDFTVDESCGKCSPCRIGTKRLYEILEKITGGKGTEEDIEKLQTLANAIKTSALCGLGQTAPNPVLSTINNFMDEYVAHVKEKRCPAGVCKSLMKYVIVADKCKGCSLCSKKCPVGAISGEIKSPFVIDSEKCIKCGVCMDTCKFGAIEKR